MSADDAILLASSLLCLLAIGLVFRYNKLIGAINFFIFSIYSWYGYHLVFAPNLGEEALARWFYLLVFNTVHAIPLLLYWLYSLFKSR